MNVKIISDGRVLELSTTVDTRFILKHENKRKEPRKCSHLSM